MLTSTMKTLMVVALATAAAATQAFAAILIPITNASFEDPVLTPPGTYHAGITGWTVSGGVGAQGTQNLSGQGWFTSLPAGDNVAVCEFDTLLVQTLSSNLAVGTYNLSAYVGQVAGSTYVQPFTLGLYAGSTLLSQVGDTVTVGVLTHYNTAYTALANDPNLGNALTVKFQAESAGWVPGDWNSTEVDGFALSYVPVPEPATLALLGLGAVVVLRRRR